MKYEGPMIMDRDSENWLGKSWDLVADIGGTNMRLAQVCNGQLITQTHYETGSDLSIDAIFGDFIDQIGCSPTHVEMAAAGVITEQGVQLTNSGRFFNQIDIQRATSAKSVRILNDFEAAAWSLVTLNAADLHLLQGPALLKDKPLPKGNRLIIGAGTGLGVGVLVWSGARPCVVKGEGGHCRLAPDQAEEVALFDALIGLWPDIQMGDGLAIEAEALISGTGLPLVLEAFEKVHGQRPSKARSGDIFAKAKADPSSLAGRAVKLFCKSLGALAGDLALVFSAYGGVFLSGGVLQANPWIFDDSTFLQSFNAGGRLSPIRQNYPIYLTHNTNFGLIGAINAMHYAPVQPDGAL
ncbi:MAG: glucokinase [Cohaesibacter sp.]|nr:glucokinase [Cohaesibacter sp.]